MSVFSTIYMSVNMAHTAHCYILYFLESGPLGYEWMRFNLDMSKIVNVTHTARSCKY
jgi:hypothetical protein